MTSSAREVLKWLAVVLMTCDHVAKIIYGSYVPGLSEAGRVAFPLFALVMAYNLAQPVADVLKSARRLALWGLIAQPVHALAFGYWLPVNILLTFALCALAIYAAGQRKWGALAFAAAVLPVFVDYQWAGVGFVLLAWCAFKWRQLWPMVPAFAAVCWFNGNLWALLAIPVALGLSRVAWPVPRGRWAFYGYYVAHLACIGLLAPILRS
ncbi:TPA: conjugal transfer protein [Stenotrophomonas maltophilia]|nr:conjugal transfer protein [Stenotrophomonas maltophilia]HDS1158945.1 conjugal transfer protein [Stenotrophomonas maltophilia]HDS1168225.1 conjugal transfer protein [Stenotrophomonas maltophilia]HDS1172952.1 conjugal transfer protein [Stenotrophomonas maltophilia]HDS1177772.1 conjugal transfer protein [Stenotrophomonas maltophilia]